MKKTLLSLVAILAFASFVNAQVPARVGWWKFDDATDMLKADIGAALELTGTQTSVAGPVAGNLATEVPLGSYLTMTHGIAPNGGGAGTLVNEWTLQIDFSIPATETWYAFFETDKITSSDADFFVSKSTNSGTGAVPNAIGCGSTTYSAATITSNTWYRMVVSVKNGEFFRMYIDGTLWLEAPSIQDIDGRYALAPTIFIFQDGDGDDGTLSCSELCIWDVALSEADALLLGDAKTIQTGIRDTKMIGNTSDLMSNYPNPVAHNTKFPYQVLKSGEVTFRILDQTGKVVQVINAGTKTPGKYNLDYNSDKLTNGIYSVQMIANNRTSVRKMVVIR